MLRSPRQLLRLTDRGIFISCVVRAEPPKAKRKIDQAVAKLREDRRRKKLERGIHKLQSYEKVLKPIAELEVDRRVLKEKDMRKRPEPRLSEAEMDARLAIGKRWQQYIRSQRMLELSCVQDCVRLQEQALAELRSLDRRRYEDCLRRDDVTVQMRFRGPAELPPSDHYEPPQGDYDENTNLFEKGYKITVLDKKTIREEMFEQVKQMHKKSGKNR